MNLEFKAAAREARDEPLTFSITAPTGKTETFKVADEIPGLTLIDFARVAADPDSGEDNAIAFAAMGDFLQFALAPGEWKRCRRFCMKERVDLVTLMQVTQGVMEAMAGRPTEPSSSSPTSPQMNGHSSKDEQPSLEAVRSDA